MENHGNAKERDHGAGVKALVEKLGREQDLSDEEFLALLRLPDAEALFAAAREARDRVYGRRVFIRGLIEFTNFCKNDCLYCGIRRSNQRAQRYRLTKEEILECCEEGYALGFRTFVLQGGEDPYFTDDKMADIVAAIRALFPDCAITLSIGERSRASYERLFAAGANRYLLRHETADPAHYARLHPPECSLENRLRCLRDLKDIGFQTGAGFMVGSPGQTDECLLRDFRFLQQLRPQMVGIGPFLPHRDTPFRDEAPGSEEKTLRCLAIVRLLLPRVLLPATTALGTLDGDGREKGMNAGCNVIMPNLSPRSVRKKYLLYDNKRADGDEAAEGLAALRARMNAAGYEIVVDRGDFPAEEEGGIPHEP